MFIVLAVLVIQNEPPKRSEAAINKQDVHKAESRQEAPAEQTQPQVEVVQPVEAPVVPQPAPKPVEPPKPKPVTYAASGNRAIGQQMAAAKGWTGDQWNCLERLWTKESNWNHAARNKSSGAHGIVQSLPASKMSSHGADYLTNPRVQIAWGLDYVKNRYGSPCAALNFHYSNNWY